MSIKQSMYNRTLIAGVIVGLAGCGAPAKHPMVEQARAAVAAAEQNPQVNQHAPVPLKEAEEQFNRAETLWKQGADEQKIEHQAYLAKQRAAIAVEKAELRAAEQSVEQARVERDKVRIQARAREAELARQQAEQAKAKAESFQEEIEELKARETERGLVLTLRHVLFDYNKADLKAGAYRTVDRLARFLQEHQERNILIEGFTDSKGSEEYNRRLSEARAMAVREALFQRGINANRIQVRGYGEAFPVASNDTSAGRAQNRRVEVIISDADGTIPARGS